MKHLTNEDLASINILAQFSMNDSANDVFNIVFRSDVPFQGRFDFSGGGRTSCRESCSTYFDRLSEDHRKNCLLLYCFNSRTSLNNFTENLKFIHLLEEHYGIKRTEIVATDKLAVALDISEFWKSIFGNSLFTLILRFCSLKVLKSYDEMLDVSEYKEGANQSDLTHPQRSVINYINNLNSSIHLKKALPKFKRLMKDLHFCSWNQGESAICKQSVEDGVKKFGISYSTSQIVNLFNYVDSYTESDASRRANLLNGVLSNFDTLIDRFNRFDLFVKNYSITKE